MISSQQKTTDHLLFNNVFILIYISCLFAIVDVFLHFTFSQHDNYGKNKVPFQLYVRVSFNLIHL